MTPTIKDPPTTSTKHSSSPASSPETGMTITTMTMTSTKLSTLKSSTDETTMTQTGASTQRTEGNVYFEFMKNVFRYFLNVNELILKTTQNLLIIYSDHRIPSNVYRGNYNFQNYKRNCYATNWEVIEKNRGYGSF